MPTKPNLTTRQRKPQRRVTDGIIRVTGGLLKKDTSWLRLKIKKEFPSLQNPKIVKQLEAITASPHLSPREANIAMIRVFQGAVYEVKTPQETLKVLEIIKDLANEAHFMQTISNYTVRRKKP